MAEQESLEMDETLEKIVFYCLDEARGRLEADGECAPFTVVVNGDQMFVENYPDEDVETCRANAQANVKTASSFASHYAFCYDGFLETNRGALDAVIVEAADRDMEQAYVIGLLYEGGSAGAAGMATAANGAGGTGAPGTADGERRGGAGALVFKDQPAFIDYTPTFFNAAAVAYAEGTERGEDEDEVVRAAKEIADRRRAAEAGGAEPAAVAAGETGADGVGRAAAPGATSDMSGTGE